MNITLNQITNLTNNIYKQFNIETVLSYNAMNTNLNKLMHITVNLKKTLTEVNNIYVICNNIQTNKYNIYPTIKDNTPCIKNQDNLIKVNVANNININAKVVNNINDIPNMPLYWIQNINQFGIKINNTVFKGNIGNIYNKKHIQSGINVNQTIICKYGNKCNSLINNKICKFYHDPSDLLILLKNNSINKITYNTYIKLKRNFINTSWIHTEMPIINKNINMRHFGSRNTLNYDFDLIQIENNKSNKINIQNIRHQCIHDILVILCLKSVNII
jgi:hypothetical protein